MYYKCIHDGNPVTHHTLQSSSLTGVRPGHLGLQLLNLFNQQRDVLQQVFVLQQQLVDSSLRLQSGRGLRVQLVPQKVDLQEMMRSEDRRGQPGSQALTRLFWNYHVDAGICVAARRLGIVGSRGSDPPLRGAWLFVSSLLYVAASTTPSLHLYTRKQRTASR